MTDLQQQLLNLSRVIAQDSYGCDLSHVSTKRLRWYLERVTPEILDAMASDLASDAWQAF
jgi:hypothetical protein